MADEEDSYRVAILGAWQVGKTTLASTFASGYVKEDIRQWYSITSAKRIDVDGRWCMLNFGDRNRFNQWARDSDGFVLTYSTTSWSSFVWARALYQRIQHIKSSPISPSHAIGWLAPSPVVILVGTKADLATEREVTKAEGKIMAQRMNAKFFEVSKYQIHTLEACFHEAVRIIRCRKGPKHGTRASWQQVRSLVSRVYNRSYFDSEIDLQSAQLMTTTSFTKTLRDWTCLKDELQQEFKYYNLQELLDELQHVTSESMYMWFPDRNTSPYLLGRIQQWIEAKTGESWDWYPLTSYPRYGQQPIWDLWNDVVLRWKCNCGDVRWAIIPEELLLHSFANFSESRPGNVKTPSGRTAAGQKAASTGGPSHGSGASTNAAGSAGAWPTQPASGSVGPHAGSRLQAAVRQVTAPQSSWVLFLVRRGSNFRLSHLNTSSISCHDFFAALRTTYLGLRGRMRAWFSVWQYSHCDFYMCEKFEEDEVAPRKRDSFPDASDPFYQFTPRPMDRIPPISRHEFYRRFHTCLETTKKYHVHHTCKVMRGHTRDVLHLLPQRTQELELGGDKRELFWGLYAREAVSLQRVLVYNAVCLFPVLGFFFAWLFGGFGSASDLQNASVPIGLMTSLLSLFWSLFLSSLQFGRSH